MKRSYRQGGFYSCENETFPAYLSSVGAVGLMPRVKSVPVSFDFVPFVSYQSL